jgi:hypothetical protein
MNADRLFVRAPGARSLTQIEMSWVRVFSGAVLKKPTGVILAVDDGSIGSDARASPNSPHLLTMLERPDGKVPLDAEDWQKSLTSLVRELPPMLSLIEDEGRLFLVQADEGPWLASASVMDKGVRARLLGRILPDFDFIRHIHVASAAAVSGIDSQKKAGALRKAGRFFLRYGKSRLFWERIESVGEEMVRPLARQAFSATPVGRTESFEDAVRRLSLTRADLEKRYSQFVFATYMYATFAMISLISVAAALRTGPSAILILVAPAAFIMFLALSFQYSFRAWQIKTRRLGGTKEFLATPNAWFPR